MKIAEVGYLNRVGQPMRVEKPVGLRNPTHVF